MKTLKTAEDWLNLAKTFYLGKSQKYYYNGSRDLGAEIVLHRMEQLDKSIKWMVTLSDYCLGKDGSYYFSRMPSERTDEYLAMCRFDSKEEAYEAWVKNENTPKKGEGWIDVKSF